MRYPSLKGILVLALIAMVAVSAAAQRTKLKPGFTLSSPQSDVDLGKEATQEVEKEQPILNNRQAEEYINALGQRLASKAPGEKYPYQFKIVNSKEINAFALPGGFIYVNRGIFENADNEAQLAGVIGHEIGHVALRHGANQMAKGNLLSLATTLLGNVKEVAGLLAQVGGYTFFLKNSRDAESQADLMATQILYDSGYDPRATIDFFEKLDAASKGGRPPQFLSDHPNPDNRITKVKGEIVKLGGAPVNARSDSSEFRAIKDIVSRAPESGPRGNASSGATSGSNRGGRPALPSTRYVQKNLKDMTLRYPDNWQINDDGRAITLAPERGVVSGSLAYGMIVETFSPRAGRNGQITLEDATDQVLEQLGKSNPKMRVVRNQTRVRISNQNGLSTVLSNESPVGGQETDVLVTVFRPGEMLYYFICVVPQNEFPQYQNTFNTILSNVKFR